LQADEKITLSKARLENAEECLRDARLLADSDRCKALVNRTYYAVFHAMRAVLVLDEFDSKKHSGIIAEFRRKYIKTGNRPTNFSKIIYFPISVGVLQIFCRQLKNDMSSGFVSYKLTFSL